MATRINTKFIITLVSVLVLLVLGLAAAFLFLKKDAADHIRIAEKALVAAEAAYAQGDIEVYNAEYKRAATHFGNAKHKDPSLIEPLYRFIDAHEQVICLNLTSASNQLDSILAGAANIHDTVGASEEDRAQLYERLHKRIRMQLFLEKQSPIGSMLGFATRRLEVAPEDAIAKKYLAMGVAYMAEQRTSEEDIQEDLQTLAQAIEADPSNPWLQTAMARYHLGNARRLAKAAGGQMTAEVNAGIGLSSEHINNAMQLAQDNLPAFVEAATVLNQLRTDDEALASELAQSKVDAAVAIDTKLQEKAERDVLFLSEISAAVNFLKATRRVAGAEEPLDGRALALGLALTLVEDRPEEPAAYEILASLQRERNLFEDVAQSAETGLAIERHANAAAFIQDSNARMTMQSLLADVKTLLAARAESAEQREALLQEAGALIDEMAVADTTNPRWRDPRVNFLRGQLALLQDQPQKAVEYLDAANTATAYNNKNGQTLRLLAQAHTRLRNDRLATGYYETLVLTLRSTEPGDTLNLINRYLAPGDGQQLDRAEALLTSYRERIPSDIRAVQMQARLLIEQEKFDDAIALLREQDLEKYPQLLDMITGIRATNNEEGGLEDVINLFWERLADRAEGEPFDLTMATQLLNLIPDTDQKRAALDRMVNQEGMDSETADVFRRMLDEGQATVEDELALIDLQPGTDADKAMKKFEAYRRRNQFDLAKPFLAQAAGLEPDRADVVEWQFRMALLDSRWDDAQQAITAMLKLSPSDRSPMAVADGRFMRAQLLASRAAVTEPGEQRNKQLRDAVVAYNNALDEFSHYVDGWVQLGRLYYVQQNYFAAQDSLLEALNRQSQNVEALELMGLSQQANGDPINAMERFEQILSIRPNHPTALDRYTALARQNGLTERAIELRERIAEQSPRNFNNRRVLALLYASEEAHDQAKQAIQAAIDAEGNTRQNMTILSQVLAASEEHDEAIQAVQGYLAELGDQVQWRDQLLLVQAAERAGQTELSDTAIDQAIAMEQTEGTFSSTLAKAQLLVGRGQMEAAAALFERLIAANPDNQSFKSQAAGLFMQLGDFNKIEALANDLPESAQRYQMLVQSARAQGNALGLALQRAEDGVKAYPNDFTLRLNLVELRRIEQDRKARGDRDYASLLALAQQFATDYPNRVEAKVMLSDAQLRVGQRGQATATLQEGLALSPRHLATNERLFAIKLQDARGLAASNPAASQATAAEALRIMAVLLESRPDGPGLLRGAGEAAKLAGARAASVEYFGKAFEQTKNAGDLSTYASALLAVGQGQAARAVLEGEGLSLVNNDVMLRALRGRAIAATGDFDAANNLFTNILKQVSEPAIQTKIVEQLILSYRTEPGRAAQVVENALGADVPAAIDLSLAASLMAVRSYEAAGARLQKYVANPTDDLAIQFSILTQLALALQESGQYVEAKAAYEIVFEKLKTNENLIPKSQQVQMLNNMAYLLVDQLDGYESDAVDYAQRALALLPANVSPLQRASIEDTLGWAYFKTNQLDEAIEMLKASVENYPLSANQLHLGRAYLAVGDQPNKDRAYLVLESALDQAKAEGDAEMIAETEKWFRQAQ